MVRTVAFFGSPGNEVHTSSAVTVPFRHTIRMT
jgi:hypothetical protein